MWASAFPDLQGCLLRSLWKLQANRHCPVLTDTPLALPCPYDTPVHSRLQRSTTWSQTICPGNGRSPARGPAPPLCRPSALCFSAQDPRASAPARRTPPSALQASVTPRVRSIEGIRAERTRASLTDVRRDPGSPARVEVHRRQTNDDTHAGAEDHPGDREVSGGPAL